MRFVALAMMTGPNSQIKQMTSQATKLAKTIDINEAIFVCAYVFLTIKDLPISDESITLIFHVMGILRVNAFSVNRTETIATGLFWPSNLINHSCKDGNVKALTPGRS